MNSIIKWLFQSTQDGASNLQAIIMIAITSAVIYIAVKEIVEIIREKEHGGKW